MFHLRVLGSLKLTSSDGEELKPVLSQPKRLALLVYLAVAKPGELVRRDTLLALFWPERDDAHARNALSQSLSFLRRNLSDQVFLGRGTEEVGLAPGHLSLDTEEFDSAVQEERWSDALKLYGGDFLEGFHVADAWGFGDWVEEERERRREVAAGAAWSLAQEQIDRNELVEAERTAQRALSLVWSDETPVQGFIRSMAEAGDRAAALSFYGKFSSKLEEELEVEPSTVTQGVAHAIRRGDIGAPSTQPAEDPPPSSGPEPPSATPGLESPPSTSPAVPGGQANQGPWKLWFWSLVFAATVCFAAVGIYRLSWLWTVPPPIPPDRPFTVLATVGGSAAFEDRDCVGFLLQTGLDVSHVVQTVPGVEVERVMDLMERDPDTPVTPSLAREVAARLGAATVVVPRLDRLDGRFVFAVRVEDVGKGILLAESRGDTEAQETVVGMVSEVIRDVRRKLGESRVVLARSDPLPQVLTPSLEALKRYTATQGSFSGQNHVMQSRTLLWEAVNLDTAFAMAWQRLSDVYLNHPKNADSSSFAAHKVRQFRDRLTDARWADIQLHLRITDDVALWDLALEEAERAILRDRTWAGYYAMRIGSEGSLPDSALNLYLRGETRTAEAARRFDPARPHQTSCHTNHLTWTVSLNRVEEWLALLDSLQVGVPADCSRDLAFYQAQAEGDWDLADSLYAAAQGPWRWPARVEWTALQLSAVRGRVNDIHGRMTPSPEDPFGISQTQRTRLSHLFLDLVFELPPHALPAGREPMELQGRGKFPVIDFLLYGIREGFLGDTIQSQRVAGRLEAMRDTATSATFERNFETWFALLDAAPAHRRGDWVSVVNQLEPALARIHEPGYNGYLPGAAYLSWWVLAEAHENLRRRETAISFLETYFPRPVHRIDDWAFHGYFRPMANLKLGRLYSEIGEAREAANHYREFLNTFRDPDPELEWMVEEARSGLLTLALSG